MNTAIIGDGGWGTALGLGLHRNGHHVRLWGHDATYVERMRAERKNPLFLPGHDLPAEWTITSDPAEALRTGLEGP